MAKPPLPGMKVFSSTVIAKPPLPGMKVFSSTVIAKKPLPGMKVSNAVISENTEPPLPGMKVFSSTVVTKGPQPADHGVLEQLSRNVEHSPEKQCFQGPRTLRAWATHVRNAKHSAKIHVL